MLQQHDKATTEGGYDDWHNCWLLLTQAVQDCPIEDRDVRGTGQLQDVAHQDLVREGGREGEGERGGRGRERGMEVGGREVGRGRGDRLLAVLY